MLRRKMIRDIKQNLSQFITILLMVFIGIMAYSGIESYMEGMKETANNFYGDYNLQDLNVMGELSEENINTVKEISNVKNAEGKLKVNGVLENDDDTTISMNFIEENEISKFYIVDGENFNKDTKGIWLDNFFAEENNLKIGDTLKVKYDGYVFEEKIVGLINVPDHVYDVKDESQLYPDHKTFGFAYAAINELEGFSYCHLFVNPIDGKVTPYFAYDVKSRIVYKDFKALLQAHDSCKLMANNYLRLEKESVHNLPTIQYSGQMEEWENEDSMYDEGGYLYKISRIIKSLQYCAEKNIVRLWNEELLNYDFVNRIKQSNKIDEIVDDRLMIDEKSI